MSAMGSSPDGPKMSSVLLIAASSPQAKLRDSFRRINRITRRTSTKTRRALAVPVKAVRALSKSSHAAMHHIIAKILAPSPQRELTANTLSVIRNSLRRSYGEPLPQILVTTPGGWEMPGQNMLPTWKRIKGFERLIRRRRTWINSGLLCPPYLECEPISVYMLRKVLVGKGKTRCPPSNAPETLGKHTTPPPRIILTTPDEEEIHIESAPAWKKIAKTDSSRKLRAKWLKRRQLSPIFVSKQELLWNRDIVATLRRKKRKL